MQKQWVKHNIFVGYMTIHLEVWLIIVSGTKWKDGVTIFLRFLLYSECNTFFKAIYSFGYKLKCVSMWENFYHYILYFLFEKFWGSFMKNIIAVLKHDNKKVIHLKNLELY